jgi:hypothetical protein
MREQGQRVVGGGEAGMRLYCAAPRGRKRERGPPAVRVRGSDSHQILAG